MLEVKVLNIDLKEVSSNITFTLNGNKKKKKSLYILLNINFMKKKYSDPYNHFEISKNEPLNCYQTYCLQIIKYLSKTNQATTYSMNIGFIQQYLNNKIFSTYADIYVVFKSQKIPTNKKNIFLKKKYQFEIDKNLEPGSIIRNISFEFNESNRMGFNIELLNFNDLSPASDLLEIVPSYIEGPSISLLKLKQKINSNSETLKYLVCI